MKVVIYQKIDKAWGKAFVDREVCNNALKGTLKVWLKSVQYLL